MVRFGNCSPPGDVALLFSVHPNNPKNALNADGERVVGIDVDVGLPVGSGGLPIFAGLALKDAGGLEADGIVETR
jgi:hypothetical protein